LPFLVSLPFRLFVRPEIWGPILDHGALLFGGITLFVFLVVPLIIWRLRLAGGQATYPR
jgi:hypothetical protein